jgi:type I restriction-modification system DNA methylase subunit
MLHHILQVKEDMRALLVSSILISLESESFKRSYKTYEKGKQLVRFLVQTCIDQFEKGNINNLKIENLKIAYQNLTIIDKLVEGSNLKELIILIEDNIKDFIKTHKYFDVLGQLYIEYLRYANSDKGLGIVLTPPHITEFMCELAEVNKNSVVFDNCTGTGGFLVTAMKLMIEDAKGDANKIKNIKKNQLVGVENKSHIFVLACSNMFIHQDGKSNILNGSCFDDEFIEIVKKFKPTVGLLNPPYKSDKKNDVDEYEFILNNLDCIEQGGRCVAIIPMQSATAQSGKVLEFKKKLLSKHTLEAVFSMPDELFFNSKVNAVTCVMVLTSKRPHPINKKVYFGYYKDDSFVKRKNKGRIDLYSKFEKEIKREWITSYMNKEETPGFSVMKVIRPEDEWCAEAYMETDYKSLSEEDFIRSIKNYLYYKELFS